MIVDFMAATITDSNKQSSIDQIGLICKNIYEYIEQQIDIEGRASDSKIQSCKAGADTCGLAKMAYKSRRRRSKFFKSDLFAEPAWDILLDLYIARHEARVHSVSSASTAGNVPATTGLRWLQVLESEGLIVRRSDPASLKRTFVELSDTALRSMNAYFASSG